MSRLSCNCRILECVAGPKRLCHSSDWSPTRSHETKAPAVFGWPQRSFPPLWKPCDRILGTQTAHHSESMPSHGRKTDIGIPTASAIGKGTPDTPLLSRIDAPSLSVFLDSPPRYTHYIWWLPQSRAYPHNETKSTPRMEYMEIFSRDRSMVFEYFPEHHDKVGSDLLFPQNTG